MRKFIIEREIPKVGTLEREQLREVAKTSNAALAKLGTDIQWVMSYVADEKTFCVYLAKDEPIFRLQLDLMPVYACRLGVACNLRRRRILQSALSTLRLRLSLDGRAYSGR